MDALEILKAAREKIAAPEMWGKGMRGDFIEGRRPRNTCCAAEAIEDLYFGTWSRDTSDQRSRAFTALRRAAGIEDVHGAIPEWNDAPERTHAEVLAAYDLAIATLRLA